MQEFIQSFGVLAPIIYLLMFAILPIFFFPVPILAVAGGLVFGFFKGSLLTFLGACANCYIMFLISRKFGRDYVVKLLKKRMSEKQHKRIFGISEDKLMISLVILRLIPLVPYNLINYGFGLTSISTSKYMLASILGIIPGTIVFLNFGDKATNIWSIEFLISVFLVLLLIIISLYISKIIENKENKKSDL